MINFQNARFIAGFTHYDHIIAGASPEVAFWGRSNVGKSSLIGALANNQKLVRVSKNPGCTRQINLFAIEERLILADLPGYGYSRVSKEEVLGWRKLILAYLSRRRQLRLVVLLVDSRRGLMEIDHEMLGWLRECGVRFAVVLTKIDKTPAYLEIVAATELALSDYTADRLLVKVLAVSSHKGKNMDQLKQLIAKIS